MVFGSRAYFFIKGWVVSWGAVARSSGSVIRQRERKDWRGGENEGLARREDLFLRVRDGLGDN